MIENKINPKALNFEAMEQSVNKITVGFKCKPQIKLALAQESQKLGITLSEHVENLIMNLENIEYQFKGELSQLKVLLKEKDETINFYENKFLNDLFNKYKSQTVDYVNSKGENMNLKITDIKDVYTIIINSFKIK